MGIREDYQPGTFCWVDLSTTAPAKASAFYQRLFGWEWTDYPAGDGIYTMATPGGRPVAGLYTMADTLQKQGVPSHWSAYIRVGAVDAVAARVPEAGGRVEIPPFSIPGMGRMAGLTDSTRAPFNVWEPDGHPGAARVNEPGCFCWNDLNTRDPRKAAVFYNTLFGWTVQEQADLPGYHVVHHDGRPAGGIRDMRGVLPDAVPPHWNVWFSVADLDESLKTIKKNKGTRLAPVQDVPGVGRLALVRDSAAAVFVIAQLLQPDP